MARAWHTSCRWAVMANTNTGRSANRKGWVEVYCTGTKKQARADARSWKRETGQTTRVVPGPGHKTKRGF